MMSSPSFKNCKTVWQQGSQYWGAVKTCACENNWMMSHILKFNGESFISPSSLALLDSQAVLHAYFISANAEGLTGVQAVWANGHRALPLANDDRGEKQCSGA